MTRKSTSKFQLIEITFIVNGLHITKEFQFFYAKEGSRPGTFFVDAETFSLDVHKITLTQIRHTDICKLCELIQLDTERQIQSEQLTFAPYIRKNPLEKSQLLGIEKLADSYYEPRVLLYVTYLACSANGTWFQSTNSEGQKASVLPKDQYEVIKQTHVQTTLDQLLQLQSDMTNIGRAFRQEAGNLYELKFDECCQVWNDFLFKHSPEPSLSSDSNLSQIIQAYSK